MFKKIKAAWRVEFNGGYEPAEITIEREQSGCFKYGDRSAHNVMYNGKWYEGYDTRYDHISTNKADWLNFWVDWINGKWNTKSVELISYEESEEVED